MKDESIKGRHGIPLDGPPERLARTDLANLANMLSGQPERETAEKRAGQLAWVLTHYMKSRVHPEHYLRYVRRYLTKLYGDILGASGPAGPQIPRLSALPDAAAMARSLSKQVADEHGHGDLYLDYLEKFTIEILEREPSVRAALVGRWMDELSEEIVKRAPSTESYAIVTLLQEIENDWKGRA